MNLTEMNLAALLLEPPRYEALDKRVGEWRKCRVLIRPKGGKHKGPRNCLVLFDGDSEPVVRPWRGIKKVKP